MFRAMLILAAALATSSHASAQGVGDLESAIANRGGGAGQATSFDVKTATACPGTAGEGEVVVCAPAERPYELDPDVRAAERDPTPPPEPDPTRTVNAERCGVGNAICDSGALPVSAIALAGVKAAVKAIKGEDWTDTFRSRPDEYQRYLDAKKRREADRRIKVGLGAIASN